MAFGSLQSRPAKAPLAEINLVPLIDVMLVLLVIFMVTAPMLTQAVKLQLPQIGAQPMPTKAMQVQLSIDADEQRYLDREPLTREQLLLRLQQIRRQAADTGNPPPELRLHADQALPYRVVAQTLADASAAGLSRISFVGQPAAAQPR